MRLLDFTPEPEYSKLRKFAFSAYGQWPPGKVIGLDTEPKYGEVKKYWPKGQANNECIKGVKLEALKHVHLFYTYRNSLIHELRNLGHGIEELSLEKEPSYHHLTDEKNEETWQLVYPLGFFENICENCIINLEKYLTENNINPYNSFNFGSYWIEELNR